MTTLVPIAEKMEGVMSGGGWYGRPVLELLHEVNPNYAFQYPGGIPYSIAGIVAHMIHWKRFIRDVLKGDDAFSNQERSFIWEQYGAPGDKTWSSMLQDFFRLHASLVNCLQDTILDLDAIVPGKSYTYHSMLEGAIEHDIYHVGQVAILHKYFQAQEQQKPFRRSILSWFKGLDSQAWRWMVMLK